MANIVWSGGGGTGQLTLGANWIGSTPPGASDVGVFNQGSQNVDPSLGQIAALAGLETYPGYTGTIGGVGNALTSSITKVKLFGGSETHLKDSAGTTTDVFIRTMSPGTIIQLDGDTMTNVHIMRGTVTLLGTMGTVSLLTIGKKDNISTDAIVTLTSGMTGVTKLRQFGGELTSAVSITDAELANGTLIQNGTTALANLYQTGGICRHNTTGTLTLFHLMDGELDLGEEVKTITNGMVWPGATLVKNDTIHTFTNALVDLRENVRGN